ncbi:hypothetical protein [Sphingobacterium spiritivorum]|uniref:hypothetical protein n=1 Tax=Sphingobacterium spiritivorum TaxID=258 RepID=UPI003DA6BD2B
MEYVLHVLENERKQLRKILYEEDLMRRNMRKATFAMKNIRDLEIAIKLLKHKSKN